MDNLAGPDVPAEITMADYRKRYKEHYEQFLKMAKRENIKPTLVEVVLEPRSVDMSGITGTDKEVAWEIEQLHANNFNA